MLGVIVTAVGGPRSRRSARRTAERAGVDRTHGDGASAPDGALARRFADGDESAVRDVYRRYGRPVFTVALTVLGDRELAAEAVQVTFLKAWRAADSYDPSRPLAPWLYRIARRAAIDVARSERRHRGGELGEEDATTAPVDIGRAWEVWQVRRAVDGLEEDEREIIRLQYFSDLTHDQIAARLEIPPGTVKSRSHRARRRLAAALAHLEAEPT